MSRVAIKQISNRDSSPDSYIAFDGQVNVWRKIHHTVAFSRADLDASKVLTVDHELGRKYVNVSVYDENNVMLIPDSVQVLDIDTLKIDFTSYFPALQSVVGEWTVTIS